MSRVELPPVRSDTICKSTYCIYIDISLLKTKNINTKIYISLEQLRMNKMQQTSTIQIVLSKCGFHLHHCQSQLQSFYVNNLFFWRKDSIFDNVYIIAREKLCHPCTIGARQISYNAGRCFHIQTPAGVHTICDHAREKNRPKLRRLSNSPVICKSLKSYGVNFVFDHSMTVILLSLLIIKWTPLGSQ